MITTAAIATFAPVLMPFGEAAPAAEIGTGGAAEGAADWLWLGAPVVDVPHLPQNWAVSPKLAPQFLQNLLIVRLRKLQSYPPDSSHAAGTPPT
jgi:hypothetical protein